jgi:hypothetical protein
MSDEVEKTEARTREVHPVSVATVDGVGLLVLGTHESIKEADEWIKANARENVLYMKFREIGKRVSLKIETVRRFEEI